MDRRFAGLFNLSETQAIAVLDTPYDRVGEEDSRYIAAAHLVNYPSEQTVQALIRAVQQTDPALANRIVRRKSVETLGRLQARPALSVIRSCLADDDRYTVENAVWAIGEIGTQDPTLLEEVAQLLEKPDQTYRVIIHTLTQLNYEPALERIRPFMQDGDPPTASAAIAAVSHFTQDPSLMARVGEMLRHPNVLARRLSIQDLVDQRYYDGISAIARCPVSLVFRLRGLRLLAQAGLANQELQFVELQPALERTLRDHPDSLDLVHRYDEIPVLPVLVRHLYETDFGRCYLAVQTILKYYPEAAPQALMANYAEEAYQDYGAHFHVIKLLGWLQHAPAYDLFIDTLHNSLPQFQKSRAAAAIALGELGNPQAIPELKTCLQVPIWDLQYAALMALEQLGDRSGYQVLAQSEDPLIKGKCQTYEQNQ